MPSSMMPTKGQQQRLAASPSTIFVAELQHDDAPFLRLVVTFCSTRSTRPEAMGGEVTNDASAVSGNSESSKHVSDQTTTCFAPDMTLNNGLKCSDPWIFAWAAAV